MSNFPLLSLAIWCPIIFGIVILVVGRENSPNLTRWISFLGALISFIGTLPILSRFNTSFHGMQFTEKVSWINRFNINYHLGIDGISLWFVLLTAFVTILIVISSWQVITKKVSQYMGAFLVLSGLMTGVFCALDGMLFYVFFESTLIPMFIIIGIWGGNNRVYATMKFFLYTLMGSLLMLVALLYLYFQSRGSFDIETWYQLPLTMSRQTLIFFAFLMAFAVKVPMWPVHTWLPDAHVEAPTGGSVVLAAIMLKIGCYGFLRFSLPITPDASHYLANFMISLSLIAVIYIGLVALVQTDMKKLVAYSSIAHMGFVTLGLFLFNDIGLQGAIIQMISHGFVSGAMFLCIGVLYDRMHTRQISEYGGVVNVMPQFATLFILFSFANAGLPGTSGFVGEFMVIMGAVKSNFWIGALAAISLILGAAYSLWLVKRVLLGPISNVRVREIIDLNKREFTMLSIFAVAVIGMGIFPRLFTDVIQTSTSDLLKHLIVTKIK